MPNRPKKKDKSDPAIDRKNKLSVATFMVKSKAEAGVEMPIMMPDGTDSGHRLTVRGIDSDTYRHARAARSRRSAEILSEKKPEDMSEEEWGNHLSDLNHAADCEVLAKLVAGWTFPDEFTPEAVLALITNSPFIANQVDTFACNRARFFGMPLTN